MQKRPMISRRLMNRSRHVPCSRAPLQFVTIHIHSKLTSHGIDTDISYICIPATFLYAQLSFSWRYTDTQSSRHAASTRITHSYMYIYIYSRHLSRRRSFHICSDTPTLKAHVTRHRCGSPIHIYVFPRPFSMRSSRFS